MEISSKWISTSQFSSYILPSLNDVIVKVLRIDKSEIKPLSVISFFEKASYWCSHRTPRKNRRDFIFCQTQYYNVVWATQWNWNVLAPLYISDILSAIIYVYFSISDPNTILLFCYCYHAKNIQKPIDRTPKTPVPSSAGIFLWNCSFSWSPITFFNFMRNSMRTRTCF